jgi:uncharacterized protein YndB with AHSA1/START domain
MTTQFKTLIDAPREKVWDILWADDTYPKWTAAFCEGSRAITDWQEGSKVLFTDGQDRGMVSMIYKKVSNEYMSFKVLGEYINGAEDYTSENAKQIAGGFENYTLTPEGDKTLLLVELSGMQMSEEISGYFEKTWPKAMEAIKTIAEEK